MLRTRGNDLPPSDWPPHQARVHFQDHPKLLDQTDPLGSQASRAQVGGGLEGALVDQGLRRRKARRYSPPTSSPGCEPVAGQERSVPQEDAPDSLPGRGPQGSTCPPLPVLQCC